MSRINIKANNFNNTPVIKEGDFNELMLAGTLAGVEMGLMKSKIPYKKGGILKALEYLC